MKILVTGANGFIGKNLIAELKNKNYNEIYECDINTTPEELDVFTQNCNFIFHLAGVNRPDNVEDFMTGNFGFTSILLEKLKKYKNNSPILITSSIQAELKNPYGESKKAGEDLMFAYEQETGSKVFVFRLSNVFGKWCKPNYNSVIATFSNNIANDLPIKVNDPNVSLNLIYIDDLVDECINALEGKVNKNDKYCYVKTSHDIKLCEIVDLLNSFKESRKTLMIPNMEDGIIKKLYSTYLSYLPIDKFNYPVKINIDDRGSFTELFKTLDKGQVSVNISKPGVTKGNHWHHTKNEKFVVVSGTGIIRFRKVGTNDVIEYKVAGDKLEIVDIPTGYTHNIENIGKTDLITIMWANEILNKDKTDTYFMEV